MNNTPKPRMTATEDVKEQKEPQVQVWLGKLNDKITQSKYLCNELYEKTKSVRLEPAEDLQPLSGEPVERLVDVARDLRYIFDDVEQLNEMLSSILEQLEI